MQSLMSEASSHVIQVSLDPQNVWHFPVLCQKCTEFWSKNVHTLQPPLTSPPKSFVLFSVLSKDKQQYSCAQWQAIQINFCHSFERSDQVCALGAFLKTYKLPNASIRAAVKGFVLPCNKAKGRCQLLWLNGQIIYVHLI